MALLYLRLLGLGLNTHEDALRPMPRPFPYSYIIHDTETLSFKHGFAEVCGA